MKKKTRKETNKNCVNNSISQYKRVGNGDIRIKQNNYNNNNKIK